jgi:hypothetical protein
VFRVGLLFVLAAAAQPGAARDYFVSSTSGLDQNDGLSARRAWKTVARVTRAEFLPGDRVRFRRGDSWQETLRPRRSGSPEHPIIFTAYGRGAKPVLGSEDQRYVPEAAIDNNQRSHVVYEELETRGTVEGVRIYLGGGTVRDIVVRNCKIKVESTRPGLGVSAGIYAYSQRGTIAHLVMERNEIVPVSRGLEHWGIYLASGVTDFRIADNRIAPAGEDGITVWHSEHGTIIHNTGGGNGENTIDVKDSRDVLIAGNAAADDGEYNLVVHSVDEDRTEGIRLRGNQCRRGGRGGQFSAGIAVINVRGWKLENNFVMDAYGPAVLIKADGRTQSDGRIRGNHFLRWGHGQKLPAVVVQGPAQPLLVKNVEQP